MTTAVGTTVHFPEWDDATGLPVTLTGVVLDEFREPEEEDRYQRLNYSVRVPCGRVYTPYAADCTTHVHNQEPF